MHLDDAACRIAQIESILHRAVLFRGYRSRLVMVSAFSGVIAGLLQSSIVGNAVQRPVAFVEFWTLIAVFNVAFAGFVLFLRASADQTGREKRLTLSAVSAILPSLATGGLLTLIIVEKSPESIPLLPGLWAILFGLGVCASRSVLPASILWNGLYFIISGLFALSLGQRALSPLTMVSLFGVGQAFSAINLYLALERPAFLEQNHD